MRIAVKEISSLKAIQFILLNDHDSEFEQLHEIVNNVACATSKDSDQPAKTQSDQSLFMSLEYFMTIRLLNEQHLEFQSLKVGCTG